MSGRFSRIQLRADRPGGIRQPVGRPAVVLQERPHRIGADQHIDRPRLHVLPVPVVRIGLQPQLLPEVPDAQAVRPIGHQIRRPGKRLRIAARLRVVEAAASIGSCSGQNGQNAHRSGKYTTGCVKLHLQRPVILSRGCPTVAKSAGLPAPKSSLYCCAP